MTNDAYDDFDADVRQFVNIFPKRIDEYETVLSENRIWLSRTVGIGVISGPEAIAIGLSGPALRGSGVAWDIRKSRPYAAYADMEFDVPLGENGDTYDRYLVRIEEMRQSRRIIDQALETMPDGPVTAKLPKIVKPPVGDYYHSIEGPKGEIGCYLVSDGSAQPYRVRVRPPSFINLQALSKCVLGIVAETSLPSLVRSTATSCVVIAHADCDRRFHTSASASPERRTSSTNSAADADAPASISAALPAYPPRIAPPLHHAAPPRPSVRGCQRSAT